LGDAVNVDLPWNPSRLEQRLGRIKRFGQARRTVDMLNLVYHDTQDEKVYRVLSRRLKDKFDVFGGLPDTIEDDWIESVEKLEQMMDQYLHSRQKARDVFGLRYKETIDPDKNRWELCSQVLARNDVIEKLSVSHHTVVRQPFALASPLVMRPDGASHRPRTPLTRRTPPVYQRPSPEAQRSIDGSANAGWQTSRPGT
jgi:superfamily II DNA/RNA helicase